MIFFLQSSKANATSSSANSTSPKLPVSFVNSAPVFLFLKYDLKGLSHEAYSPPSWEAQARV